MAKRKPEDPPAGLAPWMATFSDLMNLLLCFFVLLFSMSSISEEKYNQFVASMSSAFSILDGGATAIGDGILISNGVSQLNELDEYINSTGKNADSDTDSDQFEQFEAAGDAMEEMYKKVQDAIDEKNLKENEETVERIVEVVNEGNLGEQIEVNFTSEYITLSLKGAFLFDSGKATIKQEAYPALERVGQILERYAGGIIEIEGHTDNVPMHSAQYANNNELSSARALSVFDYLLDNTTLDPALIPEFTIRLFSIEKKGTVFAMKKNLLSVLVLALVLVNVILSAVMMFSVLSTNKKTAALVNSVASILSLELEQPGAEEEQEVPMSDLAFWNLEGKMTIPLSNAEGDEKPHYLVLEGIAISMNTKEKGYKTYGEDVVAGSYASVIKDTITSVVSGHTVDECNNNFEEIRKEILEGVKALFDKDFIYSVAISSRQTQ